MDLMDSMQTSLAGLRVQSARMTMLSENIANAESVQTPEGGPYRRQMMTFKAEVNRQTGMVEPKIAREYKDTQTPLKPIYDPSHELADENGFVLYPNVDTFVEQTDMRTATRSYEANLTAIESAKEMMVRSIELLR
ncbi:MAG: flagellar basal body rod protein FlgC [Pseudomonadota bacterium]|nr:flagellar basal body rod protein FlgC [Pseudomonadota bacterium]